MRFLLDMNMPLAAANALRAEGHDVVHAREAGLSGLADREIFARAVADGRILISFDLDFGDIAVVAADHGPGVVLLRLRSPRREHMLDRLRTAIGVAGDQLADGAIVLVEDAR